MRSYSLLSRHPGNAALFRAVELSLVSSLAGRPLHLHAEGLRGTGKTTILRSARGVLPTIRRVRGCVYNCDPEDPHCPQHRRMTLSELAESGVEEIAMPFCEISHSAKVGTVAGSIDLGRLAAPEQAAAALLPGSLARAHRGIVFVDEINRLADTSPELTDLLLDAMGTRPGRLQIEETGLPTVELAIQVTVWAASNPDEEPGALEDIRRQLADRFDLQVSTGKPRSRETVLEILEAVDLAARGTQDGRGGVAPKGDPGDLGRMFASRAVAFFAVRMPPAVRRAIAELYLDCGLESLRTVEAAQICVRAACALEGRQEVRLDDLRGVLPLVLGRRVDQAILERFLARLDHEALPRPAAGARQAPGAPAGSGEAGDPVPAPAGGRFEDGAPDGGTASGHPPPAADPARKEAAGQGETAGGRSKTTASGQDVRGLDGIFGRLSRLLRGPAVGPWAAGGARRQDWLPAGRGSASGPGSRAPSDLDPAGAPVFAPPDPARALADTPARYALRLDGAGGAGRG